MATSYVHKNEFSHVGSDGVFQGYALVWGEEYPDGETVLPGALQKSIERGGIKMLREHNPEWVIGKWLVISEDSHGLFVRGQLDMNVEMSRETASLMRSGALNGLSLGYVTTSVKDKKVSEMNLVEISVVVFPAMEAAVVDAGGGVHLCDSVEISNVRRTSDGYLTAFARAARTGVQVYRGVELGRPDMEFVRVLRPETEVFSDKSLRTYTHRPMTNDHPPVPVNKDNWKKYAVGQTGGEVLRDGQYVRVPIVLMDRDVIADYESGKKQLSLGYLSDIDWSAGVEDGVEYDAVQRNIRANHLAVVAAARGGPKLAIGDEQKERRMTDKTLKTMLVDGVSVEMTDTAAQIVDREFAKLRKQIADSETTAQEKTEKVSALEKQVAELTASSQKANDAQTAEIAALKQQVADSQVTPQKLDQLVKDRAEVVEKARAVIGDKLIVDGKSLADIRKQVVLAQLGDTAKDWNDTMIGAGFATIVSNVKIESKDALADAFRSKPIGDADAARVSEAYRKRDEDISNAWKNKH